MGGYFYLMASRRNGTLYAGVTNDIVRRGWEHREGIVTGFTKRYDVKRLVYFEEFGDITAAIQREKTVKHWVRRWKVDLIEKANPNWDDLWPLIARSELR
jgi:putative endonuclease